MDDSMHTCLQIDSITQLGSNYRGTDWHYSQQFATISLLTNTLGIGQAVRHRVLVP